MDCVEITAFVKYSNITDGNVYLNYQCGGTGWILDKELNILIYGTLFRVTIYRGCKLENLQECLVYLVRPVYDNSHLDFFSSVNTIKAVRLVASAFNVVI